MISELLRNLHESFVSLRGDGKIIVLFIAALLFLYLINSRLDFNIFAFILAPLAAIGTAFGKVMSSIKNKWIRVFAGLLIAIAIIMSGGLIYSGERAEKAENMYHIPEDYIEVMDYILSISDNPKVLAMPDYSMYHEIYSSRFDMLYEQRSGDDVRYLSDEARATFTELSKTGPDMYTVSKSALDAGCDFIVLKKNYYWCELPLYHFNYEVIKSFDNWEVYAVKEANYE